jgi:hypothetical protein
MESFNRSATMGLPQIPMLQAQVNDGSNTSGNVSSAMAAAPTPSEPNTENQLIAPQSRRERDANIDPKKLRRFIIDFPTFLIIYNLLYLTRKKKKKKHGFLWRCFIVSNRKWWQLGI